MTSDNKMVITVAGIVVGLVLLLIAARLLFTFIANLLVRVIDWMNDFCAENGAEFKPVSKAWWALLGVLVMRLFGLVEKYLAHSSIEQLNEIMAEYMAGFDRYRPFLTIAGILMISLPWILLLVKTGPIRFWKVAGVHIIGFPVAVVYDVIGAVAGLLGGKIYHTEAVQGEDTVYDPEAEEIERLMVALEIHKKDGATWRVIDPDNIVVEFPDGRRYRYQAAYPGMYGRYFKTGAGSVSPILPSYVVENDIGGGGAPQYSAQVQAPHVDDFVIDMPDIIPEESQS